MRGEREGKEGQVKYYSYFEQLFIEHVVAPYQNQMAVADNDDGTIGK